MSKSRDDYAPSNRNPDRLGDYHDTEPADPDDPDHSTRRNIPLAPDSVKDRLPDPFVTDKGGAVSVAEAGETYLKIQRHNWKHEPFPSKYEGQKGTYLQLLEADRHFRAKYDDLTTVMLTRRLSPLDNSNNWLTPWECNKMLHGGSIHRSVRGALNYQLDNFEYEWVAVTAPTKSAGTPHEHIYLWIDDPDNIVTTDHIVPARDKHLKHCTNAHEKHHQYQADGADGAITVQHTPDLIEFVPDKFVSIAENSPTYADTGRVLANTAGAQYLARQLVHLHLADYYEQEKETPPQALFEGAALAWASPYNWFRSSRGVPS